MYRNCFGSYSYIVVHLGTKNSMDQTHREVVRLSYTIGKSIIPASTWCMIIVIHLQLKRVMTSQSHDVIAIMNSWCCMSNIVKLMITQPVVFRFASGLNFSNPEIKVFNRILYTFVSMLTVWTPF